MRVPRRLIGGLVVVALLGAVAWWVLDGGSATTGSGVDAVAVLRSNGIACPAGLLSAVPLFREQYLDLFDNPESSGQIGKHRDALRPIVTALPEGTQVTMQLCGATGLDAWILKVDDRVLAVGVPAEAVAGVADGLDDASVPVVPL